MSYLPKKNLFAVIFGVAGFLFAGPLFLEREIAALLILSIVSFAVYFKIFSKYLKDVIFFTRMFLLIIPGIFSLIFIYFLNGYVTIFYRYWQTDTFVVKFLFLTILAIYGHGIGWWLASVFRCRLINSGPFFVNSNDYSLINGKFVFLFLSVLSIFLGYQAGRISMPLWESPYGGAEGGERLLALGIYPIWAVGCLIAMYSFIIYENKKIYYKGIFTFCVLYVVGYEFILKGRRLEPIGFVIGLTAVEYLYFKRIHILKRTSIAILIFLVLTSLGNLRSRIFAENISQNMLKESISLYGITEERLVFSKIPTIGPISATFFRAMGEIEQSNENLLYGGTYLEFLPRTLPKFIYPDRPSPAVLKYTAQGGIFELSEAYRNFYIYGCFFVPLGISFFLKSFVVDKVNDRSWIDASFYGVVAASMIRGIWYQSFVLYKTWISIVLLWGFIYSVTKIFSLKKWKYIQNIG